MSVKLKVCMYPLVIYAVFILPLGGVKLVVNVGEVKSLYVPCSNLCCFYFALGGVKFVVSVGEAQRFEMNTLNSGIDYTNNQQHEAHLWRTGKDSEILHLQVRKFKKYFHRLLMCCNS